MIRRVSVASIVVLAVACFAADAQVRRSIDAITSPRGKPVLRNEREQEVWSLVESRSRERIEFFSARERDITDIVAHLSSFAQSPDVASDAMSRMHVYSLATEPPIASTEPGANFLLEGMNDIDSRIRLECAKGLVQGPSSLHSTIDRRHARFLASRSTSMLDRQILLKVMCRGRIVGREVSAFAFERLQGPPEDEQDVFWLATATLLSRGVGAVVPILDPDTDPVALRGTLRALQVFSVDSEGSMRTDRAGRRDLLSATLGVLRSGDSEARRWVYFTVLGLVGPDRYSTEDSQLQIGRRIVAAVTPARENETVPELMELADSYVLLFFADDGRMKTDEEWRRDVQATGSSLGDR